MNLDQLIGDEVADCGSSEEPQIGLPPAGRRNRKRTAEDRAASWAAFGFAEIAAKVRGLIREAFPLHVVLTTLCQRFDQTVEGCLSSVLLLDRTGTRVRNAVPSYKRKINDGRVNPIAPSVDAATINPTRPVITRHPASYSLGEQVRLAAPPGHELHEATPILSLTGEPLGLFAIYQNASSREYSSIDSAHIAQFTHLLSAVIERVRNDDALKRSAELLEKAQQLSATCCFSWRVDTNAIGWSKELRQLFDFGPAVVPLTLEMIGTRIHSEDLPSFHEMIERARSGVSELQFEFRVRRSGDSVKYLRMVADRSCDLEGQLEYVGAFQDVTHHRDAEEALARLRGELARAARVASLGVLTAAVAHEVNQPLAGIVTNAGTCRRMLAVDPPDIDGARDAAARTIRDAERASEVVKRLRALFRKKVVTHESVNLNEAVREVIALSMSELERNRIVVRTSLDSDLPPVQGDRVQLQQVILNLLLNASDAMLGIDHRPRSLLISTKRDKDDRVLLTVNDSGVGFQPQGADRLFDAFYTTKESGMGIGLSVSRSIVESHDGRLWATLNEGPGATFYVSIPRRALKRTVTSTGSADPIRPAAVAAAEEVN